MQTMKAVAKSRPKPRKKNQDTKSDVHAVKTKQNSRDTRRKQWFEQ